MHAIVSLQVITYTRVTIPTNKSLSSAVYFQNSSLHSFLFIVWIRKNLIHMSPRANSRECQPIDWTRINVCMCASCSLGRNNSRNNSTSSNHVRPPKKGAATTPDEHPKKASSEIQSGTDPDPTAADNENATDASIEITTSTTNSTAIINDSPQSPLSPSQQQQQQKEHCDSGNYPPQSVTEGTADNSSSATAIASTTANKPPSRARAKTDHAKYGFDVVCIVFFFFRVVCSQRKVCCTLSLCFLSRSYHFNDFQF